ncbi:Hypothetical protein NTJ_01637 [Nesidiocoris tenuis]|uniref:Uncharacterized protein n=1 Tax=Nesidiocoris tenuis TaxID=355587 RepID=A0ABN7AD89_9HEMI|nr:Hypothetical protein NTJ_01637 [Nesidiocoris tenuis]
MRRYRPAGDKRRNSARIFSSAIARRPQHRSLGGGGGGVTSRMPDAPFPQTVESPEAREDGHSATGASSSTLLSRSSFRRVPSRFRDAEGS